FFACCASAERTRTRITAASVMTKIFLFIFLPPPDNPNSLDQSVRLRQDLGRNCQADLFGCLQVDQQLELGRLLYRQVRRLRTFEYLIHVRGSAVVANGRILPV